MSLACASNEGLDPERGFFIAPPPRSFADLVRFAIGSFALFGTFDVVASFDVGGASGVAVVVGSVAWSTFGLPWAIFGDGTTRGDGDTSGGCVGGIDPPWATATAGVVSTGGEINEANTPPTSGHLWRVLTPPSISTARW